MSVQAADAGKAPKRAGTFIGIAVLCVALALGGWFYLARNGLRIAIGKEALQTRIDARLPFIGARGPLHYSVNSAVIDLRADGKVGVETIVGVQILNRASEARIVGSGRLEYGDGDFFVRDIAIEDVALAEALPGAGNDARSRLRQILDAKLRAVASTALRQAEDEIRKHGGAVLGAVLDRYPVYRLKQENYKQALAKMVLEKVEVRDQELIATLNPLK